jgi:hypothetical protein
VNRRKRERKPFEGRLSRDRGSHYFHTKRDGPLDKEWLLKHWAWSTFGSDSPEQGADVRDLAG